MTYTLDGAQMQTRDAMHDALTACFSLPAYYGRNLDALWDVLTESDAPRDIYLNAPETMPEKLYTGLATLFLELCRTCPATTFRIASESIRPGVYRHFKGREYRVLHLALHSETLEPMVVYQALYGSEGIWVRPARMWNETIERDGKTLQRFSYIGE